MKNPFVSFCMTSYNQREYALIALKAAINQDYDNMEIIVSDDCSIDGSAEALKKMASSSGRNVKVLTSEKNNGILANYEKLFKEATGELIIGADGDDISEPNRVSKIVEAWIREDKKPTVIFHDGWKIDSCGRRIGTIGRRSVSAPLGACMAFSPKVVEGFPISLVKGCYQDHVLGRRALFFGSELYIPERLVQYRVGVGVSSVLLSRRMPEKRATLARIAGYEQSKIDLKYLTERNLIDIKEADSLVRTYETAIFKEKLFLNLIEGDFRIRVNAYKTLYGGNIRGGKNSISFAEKIGGFYLCGLRDSKNSF